jgi:hypothetical protein
MTRIVVDNRPRRSTTVTKREAQNVWLSFRTDHLGKFPRMGLVIMRWPSPLMNSRKRTSAAGTLLKLLPMLTA